MYLDKLKSFYERNNLPVEEYHFALELVQDFWRRLESTQKTDLESITELDLDDFINHLVNENCSSIREFIALMRYFKCNNRNDLYIHLTRYTSTLDVMQNIIKRLTMYHSSKLTEEILSGLELPYLGLNPKAVPAFTKEFMNRIESRLTQEEVQKVLTGNNHEISKDSIIPEKIEYENSESFESYLIERHLRKVKELQSYCDQKKVWFEQDVTQEVVDYVANNQEILSGVLNDNKLYITKIPYDTLSFINAKELKTKQYFACHCGFAREAILQENIKISKNWCYCSAGFAKFPFEVILDQTLQVKCIKSALIKMKFVDL
jgi:hypothetical protein